MTLAAEIILDPFDRRGVLDAAAALAARLDDAADAETGADAAAETAAQISAMAVSFAHGAFDASLARHSEEIAALGCVKGCNFCCRQRVAAFAPEGVVLANKIFAADKAADKAFAADKAADKAEALAHAIARNAAETADLDAFGFSLRNSPCVLLENDICSVYANRPVACRGQASFSRKACEDSLGAGAGAEIPFSGVHVELRIELIVVMAAALKSRGYVWKRYELNSLLHAIRKTTTPDSKLLRDERALAGAHLIDFPPQLEDFIRHVEARL